MILRSGPDKTTKSITLERWGGIWHVTSVLKGVVSSVQEDSLLRIHAPCFSGRHVEKFVVEFIWAFQEVSSMNSQLFTIGGRILCSFEAVRRDLG